MERHRWWIALLAVFVLGPSILSRAEQAGSSRLILGESLASFHTVANCDARQPSLLPAALSRRADWRGGQRGAAELRSSKQTPAGGVRRSSQPQTAANSNVRRQQDATTLLILRPPMLADQIDELAGHHIRVLDARVVGLLATNAFLIESADRLDSPVGLRDRLLVLIDGAALRVPAETIVESTVNVVGVARTLLGMKVSGEVTWPATLDNDSIKRLDVRAGVLATSVHTAEGTELTDRRSASSSAPASPPRAGLCPE
jgi:hypothetical protein